MATIKYSELEKLKTQFNALLISPGGRRKIFDVVYRVITNDIQPSSVKFDISLFNEETKTYGVMIPEEERIITDNRKKLLLSEDPLDKSLWYRLNYELANVCLEQETLPQGTTGDETRIIRSYADKLSVEEQTKLTNLIEKIEPTKVENKYLLPDFDVFSEVVKPIEEEIEIIK